MDWAPSEVFVTHGQGEAEQMGATICHRSPIEAGPGGAPALPSFVSFAFGAGHKGALGQLREPGEAAWQITGEF